MFVVNIFLTDPHIEMETKVCELLYCVSKYTYLLTYLLTCVLIYSMEQSPS